MLDVLVSSYQSCYENSPFWNQHYNHCNWNLHCVEVCEKPKMADQLGLSGEYVLKIKSIPRKLRISKNFEAKNQKVQNFQESWYLQHLRIFLGLDPTIPDLTWLDPTIKFPPFSGLFYRTFHNSTETRMFTIAYLINVNASFVATFFFSFHARIISEIEAA